MLIAAGRLIAEGLSPREAARAAVAGPLTDDSTVTRGLVEMIDVYLADQPTSPTDARHTNGGCMSYESTAEPIKLGYLFDFRCRPGFPEELSAAFTQTFELVFNEAVEQGLIDRPVQIVFREVEGLPKGTVKAVIDAYGELVDEGCLVVFGPNITDNGVPTREAIEERFKVPAISVTGTEDWLGEWTFAFPQGSLTDEPIFWADLLAKRGHTEVGVLVEQTLVGESYLKNLRSACRAQGIRIVAEARSPRPRRTSVMRCARCTRRSRGARSLRLRLRDRLHQPGARGARLGPAALHEHRVPERVDQPDHVERVHGMDRGRPVRRGQPVGQRFLDQYDAKYDGSRPEYCVPVVNRDIATTLLRAFADAHPLSPRGVKEALERVKMLPAAAGAPGTRVSFGNWTHRAWMGAGYLVARRLDPDGINSHLVDRFGED